MLRSSDAGLRFCCVFQPMWDSYHLCQSSKASVSNFIFKPVCSLFSGVLTSSLYLPASVQWCDPVFSFTRQHIVLASDSHVFADIERLPFASFFQNSELSMWTHSVIMACLDVFFGDSGRFEIRCVDVRKRRRLDWTRLEKCVGVTVKGAGNGLVWGFKTFNFVVDSLNVDVDRSKTVSLSFKLLTMAHMEMPLQA